jgi:threonine dehydrogenase-like Zn-dependent dehydrogenase
MRANCWMGKKKVEVQTVPDPRILNQRDAIVRITSTAICGSDLHLYNGFVPTMESGDVLGHEFMGEVMEVGRGVKNLKVGDRVVVPFPIACGNCAACRAEAYSLCENSNPNGWMAEKLWGHSPAGIFGYSHMLGGFAGGQAEFARVPFADVGPLKIENGFSDEQVLFLSDIFPTGFMGAEMCGI